MSKTPIKTIGYGGHSRKDLVKLLQKNDVETLIDVRSKPYSGWNRDFNRSNLKFALRRAAIVYEWRGRNIGGLKENIEFDETIVELVKRAGDGEMICLMCSEGDPKACHRDSKLKPNLEIKGGYVSHIYWKKEGKSDPNLLSLI